MISAVSRVAALDIGESFAYALVLSMDAPPLFKGQDFTHTDLKFALT